MRWGDLVYIINWFSQPNMNFQKHSVLERTFEMDNIFCCNPKVTNIGGVNRGMNRGIFVLFRPKLMGPISYMIIVRGVYFIPF